MGTVTGKVHLIEETKTFGAKGFRKRIVVLEQENGSYTNYVPLDFTKDDCDAVDELRTGDEITVEYRLNGRKWQKDSASEVRFFLSAEAKSFTVKSSTEPTNRVSSQNIFEDDDAPF